MLPPRLGGNAMFRSLGSALADFRAHCFIWSRLQARWHLSAALLLTLACCGTPASGQNSTVQNYTIQTFAGGGLPAYGGPATSAVLGQPTGIAIDGQGNLFVAVDVQNLVVRIDA